MLKIVKISVSVGRQKIINNLSLSVHPGLVYAIMGPNGSGKSTLAQSIMGHPLYQVSKGSIFIGDQEITSIAPNERAKKGLFLAFQNPCSIPGVTVVTFLKEAYQALKERHITVAEFSEHIKAACRIVGVEDSFVQRPLNDGFSGGEKKRLEMIQLLVLQPSIAILDEIDSGLDVDALKMVAQSLLYARQKNPLMSIILITHYQRILRYIIPDIVHVVRRGSIVASGNKNLAEHIEKNGYENIETVSCSEAEKYAERS